MEYHKETKQSRCLHLWHQFKGTGFGTTKRYISSIQSEVADLDIESNEIEKSNVEGKDKNNDKT